ncbi:PTS transporter subunit EIIB [Mycoplasmopsis agassizii]|uniref:PTS transporter subunit EIIB n=1 Tax=Mycoplasmopsis agassizii TaxID=33922 RepID=UPI003527C879
MNKFTKILARILNFLTFGKLRKKALETNTYQLDVNVKTSFEYQELLDNLGGKDNLINAEASLSKIKFYLKDKKLVNLEKIKKYPDVTGTLESSNAVTIIIGNAARVIAQKINEELNNGNN